MQKQIFKYAQRVASREQRASPGLPQGVSRSPLKGDVTFEVSQAFLHSVLRPLYVAADIGQ